MHVVILGNGVAGVSAGLRVRARRPDWKITIVSGESTYHWSRPALMYVFMGHMPYRDTKPFPDSFWDARRLDLVRGWVVRIDVGDRCLELADGRTVAWDKLLIATGSKPNRFGWPGQDLEGVQGMYGLYDLERLYRNTERARRAVIAGGGLIGIELAEMLHSRNIPVTLLVREKSYWGNVLNAEESSMVNRIIRGHGIELELETTLGAIEADGNGRCAAAVSDDGRRFECDLVGLTAGVAPNVDVLDGTGIDVGRGVRVDRELRTRVPDVWAAGDCAEIIADGDGPGLLQQVWYTGKMQGEVAGDNVAGATRRYDPGIWYNSAKFFDLEYQTYGLVNRSVPGERNLYWEDTAGMRSARLVYTDDGVVGLQTMGVRWRHEVAESWLHERRAAGEVIERLHEIGFDPELHRKHEGEIARTFREQLS